MWLWLGERWSGWVGETLRPPTAQPPQTPPPPPRRAARALSLSLPKSLLLLCCSSHHTTISTTTTSTAKQKKTLTRRERRLVLRLEHRVDDLDLDAAGDVVGHNAAHLRVGAREEALVAAGAVEALVEHVDLHGLGGAGRARAGRDVGDDLFFVLCVAADDRGDKVVMQSRAMRQRNQPQRW